jgi:hypothetical protein
MKTQVMISLDANGLKDISLIAETERECQQVMETYRKFEPEILQFTEALKAKSEESKGYYGR